MKNAFSCVAIAVAASVSAAAADGFAQSTPGIVSVIGSRSSITMSFLPARSASIEREQMDRLVTGCREVIDVTGSDSAAIVSRAIPPIPAIIERPHDVVELLVMPNAGLTVNCGAANVHPGLLESRGLWASFDTLAAPDRQIQSVTLSRGNEIIEPLQIVRGNIRGFGPYGLRTINALQHRLAFRLTDLMPTESDPAPSLSILITTGPGGAPDRLVVPWSAVRELIAATFVQRPLPSNLARPSLGLPTPQAPELRNALALYDAGQLADAVRVAGEQLRTGELRQNDLIWARALTGLVYSVAQDTLAARVSFELLLAIEPCFGWAAEAPSPAREFLAASARPAARCSVLSSKRVVVRSLVAPGFGRPPEQGRDLPARLGFSVLVVGSAALSQVFRMQARTQYEEYLAAQIIPNLPSGGVQPKPAALHARASSTRTLGITFVAVATTAYVTQSVLSVLAEKRFERRVRSVASYGETVTRRVGVHAGEGEAGSVRLGLEVRW